MSDQPIRILVSACLLGENTRYDGSNKLCHVLHDKCFAPFEFISICPELSIGMETPRPPVQLTLKNHQIQILGRDNPTLDITIPLRTFSKHYANALHGIYGAILKKNSPSCGIQDVKLFTSETDYDTTGIGEFCYQLLTARNRIHKGVLIDEEQLQNEKKRQLFIANVQENARSASAKTKQHS